MLGILPLAKGRTRHSLRERIMLVISHLELEVTDGRLLLFTETQSHIVVGVESWGRQESFFLVRPSWHGRPQTLTSGVSPQDPLTSSHLPVSQRPVSSA